jgi:hypothetical protein
MKMLTNPIISAIRKTPYASTDGIPKDSKKVIARYFMPGTACTWYVLEDDMFFNDDARTQPSEDMIVFGASTLGHGLELGSISLKELFGLRNRLGLTAERDISVKPFEYTLGELRKMYHEEWV